MKNLYKLIVTAIITLCLPFNANSQQNSTNITVQLSATVMNNPSKIILNWINDGTGNGYKIYRKIANSGGTWGTAIADIPSSSTQYIDNNILTEIGYEYKVKKKNGNNSGYGYINSGIEFPAVENRGKLILVVENTFLNNVNFENGVIQTIQDIEADGWIVERINVNRNDNVTSVKQSIVNIYNLDIINTKALYLLGNVPIPYSGLIYPDGHTNHNGAWPADVYYGDMDGIWTDTNINNVDADQTQNHNIPGDGKFDQSVIPSKVELQVGRVDLSNLTSFTSSEEDLLINYMTKAHVYKTKGITPNERSLIDNNFTNQPEGFASSAYRNFSVMFNPLNINDSIDYCTSTSINTGESYMWSYGCGSGDYSACSGIGTTSIFNTNFLQTIFTILFGSYFGDWNSENNLLRASIAQGETLTSVWSGRPHWQFHHMALGANIGRSARLTQNNNNRYFSSTYTNFYKRKVHIALMGDPTLRMHYISPPGDLTLTNINNEVFLSWDPSQESVLGYNVYRILPGEKKYTKINDVIITSNTYTDQTIYFNDGIRYIIKAVDLKTTASGSYYNQSLGTTTTISNPLGFNEIDNPLARVFPNPSNSIFNIELGFAGSKKNTAGNLQYKWN